MNTNFVWHSALPYEVFLSGTKLAKVGIVLTPLNTGTHICIMNHDASICRGDNSTLLGGGLVLRVCGVIVPTKPTYSKQMAC